MLAGAGSGAYNTIDDAIGRVHPGLYRQLFRACQRRRARLMQAMTTPSAQDSGGYAVAIAASGTGKFNGAGTIGASESNNAVGQGSGDSVEAYIDNSTVTAAGNVTIKATSTVKIDASAIGGSLAAAGSGGTGLSGALTGAGAGTVNTLTQKIEAYIADASSVTTTNLGNVCLTATDGSQIAADAGGVAIAIAVGNGGQGDLTIGASIATNTVANTVHADISGRSWTRRVASPRRRKTQTATAQTLTFQPSAVNTSNNQITLSDHDLNTGDRVIYHSGGGAPIGGLVDGQSYYAIVIDSNTIELALTKGEAHVDSRADHAHQHRDGNRAEFHDPVAHDRRRSHRRRGSGAGGEGLTLTFAGAGAGLEHRQ